MPQPVPPSVIGFSHGVQAVMQYAPARMAQVGAVAVAWTSIEDHLIRLFATTLGRSEPTGAKAFAQWPNWAARMAMREVETIRVRLKIFNATIGVLVKGSELEPEWAAIEKEVTSLSRLRNKVVHGHWGVTQSLPDCLTLPLKEGKHEYWTGRDFDDLIIRFVRFEVRLGSFGLRFHRAVHDGQLTHPEVASLR